MSDISKFEALLRDAAEKGAEVRLVPMINRYYGHVEFYAHIDGHDSETVDVAICERMAFLQLERGADGLRGPEAIPISQKAQETPAPLIALAPGR
jgi:hypothetical protein